MEYIEVWYGNITKPTQYQRKSESREAYDPRFPISKFFKIIEDAVQLADYENFPCQPEQILQKSYRQMEKCDIYKD